MAKRTLKIQPDKDGVYHLKQRHLYVYRDAVYEFIRYFGLSEWKLWVEMEQFDGAYGFCRADCPSQSALIGLCPKWDINPSASELRKVARHEVLELLLSPMWHATLARCLDKDWAESQRHTVIRRLENLCHDMI